MLGAIAGDIAGSVYEFDNIKTVDFPLFTERSFFTDDTVHTVALADCILNGGGYAAKLKEYYRLYPGAGYGGMFHRWATSAGMEAYNSFGNGSAMRVSPVGFAFDSLEEVLERAEASAAVTHNHPEGIKGAQAAAAVIFLARTGSSKNDIRDFVEVAVRIRSEPYPGPDTAGLSIQRDLPGDGPRGHHRLPGVAGLRGCAAPGRLPGWRLRHPGLHNRGHGPGLLRGRAGTRQGPGAGAAGPAPAGRHHIFHGPLLPRMEVAG